MSVNLTLEEVPFAILEAVKARILANRRRAEEEKKRRRRRPEDEYFTARRAAAEDDYVASTIEETALFAQSSLAFYWSYDPYSAHWRAYSGDCSNYITETIALPTPGVTIAFTWSEVDHLALPVNAETSILVMMARFYGEADNYQDLYPIPVSWYVTINRAYICSKSQIRSISIPATLQNCINRLNPDVPSLSIPDRPEDIPYPISHSSQKGASFILRIIFRQTLGVIGLLQSLRSSITFNHSLHHLRSFSFPPQCFLSPTMPIVVTVNGLAIDLK